MVLIIDWTPFTDVYGDVQIQDIYTAGTPYMYTGVQLLPVKSSWKQEALYVGLVYSSMIASVIVLFHKGDSVPSLEEVNKAHADLEGKPDAVGVWFSYFGYVPRESLRRLRHKCKVFDLADRMRRLKQWLQENHAAIRNDFMDDILRPKANGWILDFGRLGEIMCLMDEGYLGAPVIETLINKFQTCYWNKVCILPGVLTIQNTDHRMSFPRSDDWHDIRMGRKTKVFAIVCMPPDHWGLLCFDFSRREISFGDSMDQGFVRLTEDVKSAILTVVRWSRDAEVMDGAWSPDIARLNVPQQPHGSGSGGVIALNTIECSINPSVEPWTHSRSAYHRIRYLQVASGYRKLSQLNEADREPQAEHLLQSSVLNESDPTPQEGGCLQLSEHNEDDQEPQEEHCLQPSMLDESDPEPQEGDHLQLSERDEDDREPRADDVYESREAAIGQLRRWAQRSGFKLMIGHTKTGKELKVRLDCGGPKQQRRGPYSSGQHDPRPKKRTDCNFHINIRSPQKIAPAWHITSIVNSHNHDLAGRC
ncbi:hypothetical protein BGX34_012149 [Mortierella sp. NVP85]|nr:hypothetical protein BGX34_012149 [Mortierella sp. NVP85]